MLSTKRWNDPCSDDDGARLLVTRYRPRGVTRAEECWDAWLPQLAPSRELHGAAYGKGQAPLAWPEYRARYLHEMERQRFWIDALGQRVARGETLTLLCSSACVDAERCHRTLLGALLLGAALPAQPLVMSAIGNVVRRRRCRR